MGVVYKLKKHIADFIVETKKTNARLTCRDIADLVFKTYNVRVSKSSVHKILQEQGLSLPGRRKRSDRKESPAIVKKQPSYVIPPKKKKEIRKTLPDPWRDAPTEKLQPGHAEDLPSPRPDKRREISPAVDENTFVVSQEKSKKRGVAEEGPSLLSQKLSVYEAKDRLQQAPTIGAGVVFFKVLEWMLSDEAVCEPYLRDLCVAADLVDIRTAARLVMERAMFGKERFNEMLITSPQGILQLNNIEQAVSSEALDFVYQGVRSVKEWRLWIEIDLPQLLQWVQSIEIVNGRHETVSLDPSLHIVLQKEKTGIGVLNHVLGRVADVWIQNIQPAWVTVNPNQPGGWSQIARLFKMAQARDSFRGVRKIRLKALNGFELSSFECEPFMRSLMILIVPRHQALWAEMMRDLRQEAHWSKINLLGSKWRWQEAEWIQNTSGLFDFHKPHPVCLIHDDDTDFPIAALISNNPRINAMTLLEKALPSLIGWLPWLQEENGPEFYPSTESFEKNDMGTGNGSEGVEGIFSELKKVWLSMAESWYGLPFQTPSSQWESLLLCKGVIRVFERAVRVDLMEIPTGWERKKIKCLIDRIHANDIHDFENRAVILSSP